MPKNQKSSATSATRKKHARKAGGGEQLLPLPKEKKDKTGKRGKGKHAEPRQKIYIPPSKPAPVRPDPLTSTGLASRLPPDLLVILRRLAKKDPTTRQKALEELNAGWLARVSQETEATLTVALPVWLHHAPTLFLSASRRLRVLSAQTHFAWLKLEGPRSRLVQLLRGEAPPAQISALTGAWRMAADDIDRPVATAARRSWDLVFRKQPAADGETDLELSIVLDPEILETLLDFVQRAIFHPSDVHLELNPIQPAQEPILPPHAARAKGGSRQPVRQVKPVIEEEESPRQTEEDEELVEDRNGRIRVGALGALRWIIEFDNADLRRTIDRLLSSPLLWTGLYHGPSPPFCHHIETASGPLGKDQPAVRKAAWGVLSSILSQHGAEIDAELLPIIGSAVLRSAWTEPDPGARSAMWEPLLRLLTKNPKIWEMERGKQATHSDDDESDSGSEDDNSDAEPDGRHLNQAPRPPPSQSEAHREFLQFLQLGCYGSPAQGYPAIVVILSTIPPSIIGSDPSSWTDFLTSFWAALDGRALNRAADVTLFLNSLLECLVLLIRRSRVASTETSKTSEAGGESDALQSTLVAQVGRVWFEVASGRLGSEDAAGTALSRTLMSILSISSVLWEAVWAALSETVKNSCVPGEEQKNNSSHLPRQLAILKSIRTQATASVDGNINAKKLAQASEDLLRGVALSFIEQMECSFSANEGQNDGARWSAQNLGDILKVSSDIVFSDSDLANRLDNLARSRAGSLLNLDAGLFTSYIANRGDKAVCCLVWKAALEALGADSDLLDRALPGLLSAAEAGLLPSFLQKSHDKNKGVLDQVVSQRLGDVLEGRQQHLEIVKRLFQTPEPFVARQTSSDLLFRTVDAFDENARSLLFVEQSSSEHSPSADLDLTNKTQKLHAPLSLVSSTLRVRPEVLQEAKLQPKLLSFFGVGFLLSSSGIGDASIDGVASQSRAIWKTALQSSIAAGSLSSARRLSRELISDVGSRVSTDTILRVFADGDLGPIGYGSVINELFPSQEALDDLLQTLPPDPLDPSLAVVDPLVPPASHFSRRITEATKYDSQGCSAYARVIGALLKVVTTERSLLRTNLWLLRHFILLSLAASDQRMVRAAKSSYFALDVSEDLLRTIENGAKTLTSFGLADIGEGGSAWHAEIVRAFTTKTALKVEDGGLASFVLSVLSAARKEDTVRDTRVLYIVLQHVLNDAETSDAEKWLSLSRKIEKQNPNTAQSIVIAVATSGLEPPSIDRLRNELASGALGVRVSKAHKDGLALLRRLSATVPNLDSDVAFLPQNRAVNFVKACQSWLSAEDEDEEDEEDEEADSGGELETEMTHIFQHLAPILQLVPGAHWELFFDMMEENLENSSFNDSNSLPLLARTLELVNVVRELAQSNRTLREDWHTRERQVFTLVKQLVKDASVDAKSPANVPRSVCWELALGILQDMPTSLINHETLPQMVHLLQDPTPDAAIMSYAILRRAAKALTEHLVVEAGVDTSDEDRKFELPAELLGVLQSSLEPGSAESNIVAYLLGWMIVFDLFDDASLRLKMGFGNQLRDLDLINSSFLPAVFELLDIGSGVKPFPLELWSVEQFYLECYDTELPLSARLLAAHLLYRAVLYIPSLITAWWSNCKDRQLSAAFRTLITRHYSPLLISSEFAHLRTSGLSGDDWSVKIAPTTGEVTVSYAVDDQALEICVEVPSDFPLHPVKVRENRRLGVEDKKWRAWLLAVQQVITSQNGRVADGISLFKKNVTSHFEDQTECAICYSIISVTEFTLPKKRCRTCKNRFHAGCLYKWFNTSHTSSCPLCRSDFI